MSHNEEKIGAQKKLFPNIWITLLIIIGLIGGQLAAGMFLSVCDLILEALKVSMASRLWINDIGQVLMSFLVFSLILAPIFYFTKPPWRTWFNTSVLNPKLLGTLIIASFGLVVIESELDNVTKYFFPIPEFIVRIFEEMLRNPLTAFILLVIAAPITEEFLFRGVFLRSFLTRYRSMTAIIVSAAVFSAVHINPYQLLGAFLAGLLLAWIYIETESILLCMLVHAFHNLLSWLCSLDFLPRIPGFSSQDMRTVEFQGVWLDSLGVMMLGGGLFLLSKTLKGQHRPQTSIEYPTVYSDSEPGLGLQAGVECVPECVTEDVEGQH